MFVVVAVAVVVVVAVAVAVAVAVVCLFCVFVLFVCLFVCRDSLLLLSLSFVVSADVGSVPTQRCRLQVGCAQVDWTGRV